MTALSTERLGRVTGSRVGKVLGLSLYGDRGDVMREMVRQALGASEEFTGNVATQWGETYEPIALATYETAKGLFVHGEQTFTVHPDVYFLGCTPDGLVGEDGMVELKCPYAATYSSITDRPEYYAQVQLQLACTGRDWCDFVIWRTHGHTIERIPADPAWLDRVQGDLEAFMQEYNAIVDDPDLAKPYVADRGGDWRADPEWATAALLYLEAFAQSEQAKTALETARQDLIDLAQDQPSQGAGVRVAWKERKPSINYRDAAKELLQGVDLSRFETPGSRYPEVRRIS